MNMNRSYMTETVKFKNYTNNFFNVTVFGFPPAQIVSKFCSSILPNKTKTPLF